MMPQIISVVGKSKSGKTTLIEKLIPELKKRGHRIGIIKHAFHHFDVDKKGKDSWRHKAAGADTVIVATRGRIAMVRDDDAESLDHIASYLQDMDLIITEGYKKENKPKIEIFREASPHNTPLCEGDDTLIAFVTDTDLDLNVPKFGLEDAEALADFVENRYL